VEKPRKSGRRQFRENIVAEIPKKQQNDCLKACTRYISYLKQKKSPNGYYEGPITLSELVHRIPEFQEIQEFQGFLTGFQRFRIFEDLKDLKYSNGFRPDFNDFRLGVRDFSDLKLGFMDCGPDFRNFSPDFNHFKDFTPGFKVFKPEIFGRVSRFTGISDIAGILDWILGILGRISRHSYSGFQR